MMNFWTGLPNYETFYALYQFFIRQELNICGILFHECIISFFYFSLHIIMIVYVRCYWYKTLNIKRTTNIIMIVYVKYDYVGRSLAIKPCVSVAPHIYNRDYVGRSLDVQPCVSVTPHISNHDKNDQHNHDCLCEVLLIHKV
jgi:hypothetical protein